MNIDNDDEEVDDDEGGDDDDTDNFEGSGLGSMLTTLNSFNANVSTTATQSSTVAVTAINSQLTTASPNIVHYRSGASKLGLLSLTNLCFSIPVFLFIVHVYAS